MSENLENNIPDIPEEEKEDYAKLNLLPVIEDKEIHSIAYLRFMEDKKLSISAKFIYLYLKARRGTNGYVWFSQKKVCNTIGISDDSYRKYLKELENVDALKQYKRTKKENGSKSTNIIIIYNYNPFNGLFEEPSNIKEIDKAIQVNFGDQYYITVNNIELKTSDINITKKSDIDTQNPPKPKKSGGANPNISGTPCTENLGEAHPENLRLPIPNISGSLPEKLGINYIKTNNRNINNRNIENKGKTLFSPSSFSIDNLKVMEILKKEFSEVAFKTWLNDPMNNAYIQNDILYIPCCNDFNAQIIKARYYDDIVQAYKKILPKLKKIKIIGEKNDLCAGGEEK